jgi:hypothetical protein
MFDELWDEQAYVCTDCLILIANGDGPDFAYQYPDKSDAEIEEMRRDYYARIDREMSGYQITLGWGREQHECASNVTVTPVYQRLDERDAREYRADTVTEALDKAMFDFPDAIGFHGVAHDLETEGDRGGECYCEEEGFSERDCAHCGTRYAGTWHAATVWKITDTRTIERSDA